MKPCRNTDTLSVDTTNVGSLFLTELSFSAKFMSFSEFSSLKTCHFLTNYQINHLIINDKKD